jgi:hypothetical protein
MALPIGAVNMVSTTWIGPRKTEKTGEKELFQPCTRQSSTLSSEEAGMPPDFRNLDELMDTTRRTELLCAEKTISLAVLRSNRDARR